MKNLNTRLLSLGLTSILLFRGEIIFAETIVENTTNKSAIVFDDNNSTNLGISYEDGENYSAMPTAPSRSTKTTTNKLVGDFTLSNGTVVYEDYITNTNNFSKTNNSQQYIVIHDTANESSGADANNHRKYFQTNDRNVSIHYVVDKTKGIHVLQDNYSAYHVGDRGNTTGDKTNSTTIGIELCVNDPKGSEGWKKVVENGVALTQKLMQEYNIPKERVIMHRDCSGKNCSARLIENNEKEWKEFKAAISETSSSSETAMHKLGRVYNLSQGDTLNVRSSANATSSIITTLNQGDKVEVIAQSSNGWYKIRLSDGKVGYASNSYIEILGDYEDNTPIVAPKSEKSLTNDIYKYDVGKGNYLTYINGKGYSQYSYLNKSGNYAFTPSSWIKAAGLDVTMPSESNGFIMKINNPYIRMFNDANDLLKKIKSDTTGRINIQSELDEIEKSKNVIEDISTTNILSKAAPTKTLTKDIYKYDAGKGNYLTYINGKGYSQYSYLNTSGNYAFTPSSWIVAAGLDVTMPTSSNGFTMKINNPYINKYKNIVNQIKQYM